MTDKHTSSDKTSNADRHDETSIPIDLTDAHDINAENTVKEVDDEIGTLQEKPGEGIQAVASEVVIDEQIPGEASVPDALITDAEATDETAIVDMALSLDTMAASLQKASDENMDVGIAPLQASSAGERSSEVDVTSSNSQSKDNDGRMNSAILGPTDKVNGSLCDSEAKQHSEKSQLLDDDEARVVDVGNEMTPEIPSDTVRTIGEEIITGDVATLSESRLVGDEDISADSQSPRSRIEDVIYMDDVRTAHVVDNDADKESTEDTVKDTFRTDIADITTTNITENSDKIKTDLQTDRNDTDKEETNLDTKL